MRITDYTKTHGQKILELTIPSVLVSMPAAAFTGADAISFRGVNDTIADLHLEGSECCLIHADNPASSKKGVYLNPQVRVGYTSEAYRAVHPKGFWLSRFSIFTGLWKNRVSRWTGVSIRNQWFVHRRWRDWQRKYPSQSEPGKSCLINEMQVLAFNGWSHA